MAWWGQSSDVFHLGSSLLELQSPWSRFHYGNTRKTQEVSSRVKYTADGQIGSQIPGKLGNQHIWWFPAAFQLFFEKTWDCDFWLLAVGGCFTALDPVYFAASCHWLDLLALSPAHSCTATPGPCWWRCKLWTWFLSARGLHVSGSELRDRSGAIRTSADLWCAPAAWRPSGASALTHRKHVSQQLQLRLKWISVKFVSTAACDGSFMWSRSLVSHTSAWTSHTFM